MYYTALGGQTVFPLGTPDEFGNIGRDDGESGRAGVSQWQSADVPPDGYTLDVTNNQGNACIS